MLLAAQSPKDRRTLLSAHADNAFALAHALTLDASVAATIVETVFRRAYEEQPPAGITAREWVLMMVRDEADRTGSAVQGMSIPGGPESSRLKRRIRRIMPEVLPTLSSDDRAMLILANVERLDEGSIGKVLGLDAESVSVSRRLAESRLKAAIARRLPEDERGLLQQLSAGHLRDAFAEMAAHELPGLPPTARLEPPPAGRTVQPSAAPGAKKQTSTFPTKALRNVGVGILVIFFAGLFAYGAVRLLDRPPDVGAISVTVRAAEDTPRIMYPTDDATRAAEYIQSELDWQLNVPQIEGALLQGASRFEIIPETFIPLVTYHDEATNELIPVFVYNYALLHRIGDRLRFEPETLRQIEDESHFELHDMGSRQVLVWRNRDDIFVAVTQNGAEALQDRIYVSP